MEKLDQSLSTFVEKLQGAGFEQAPAITSGAVRAIYYDGLLQLGTATFFTVLFLCFLALLLAGLFSKRLADSGNDAPAIAFGGFGGITSMISFIAISTTDNPWLKVFDPQAAFYQQIMKAIL